jgi:hypothetical protein
MKAMLRPLFICGMLLVIAAGPPQTGLRFLLLESRQLVEGEIEQVGDGFRVKRDGGETTIPIERVMAVCVDKAGAFRVLSEKTDPKNAEQRLKLAEWCHNNGLTKEAVAEARAAVELRPNSPVAQRFLHFYEQAATERKPAFKPEKPVTAEPAALPETVDCSPEALKYYCTRVQPVLMNACSGCHSTTAKFHLERVYSDTLNPRGQTFQNLAATMALIDRAKPSASPLLQKALTAHGNGNAPPLRDRGTPAYQHLEQFARMLASSDAVAPIPAPAAPKPEDAKSGFAGSKPDEKPAGPKDAFDPAEFNKKHHPDKQSHSEPPT